MGRRLTREVRLLRQAHGRDMWFLGKTLVASDKLMRFGPFSSQCRAGNVEILRGPWKADLFRVLEGFPNSPMTTRSTPVADPGNAQSQHAPSASRGAEIGSKPEETATDGEARLPHVAPLIHRLSLGE